MKTLVFLSAFCPILLNAACAATVPTHGYHTWLDQLRADATASGVSEETLDKTLGGIVPDDRVIRLDQKQPEKKITFVQYLENVLPSSRIEEAVRLKSGYADLLDAAERRYGVPVNVILALWGMESNFGRNQGDFSVVRSLLTLAYDGRRSDFFRGELIEALRIIDHHERGDDVMTGSWAGAMGACQFMPTTYSRFAIDGDGDGVRDIWGNEADIFASIANYLVAEGWQAGAPWGQEVRLTRPISESLIGLEKKQAVDKWQGLGVEAVDDSFANKALDASLIQPDGQGGRSFLVYDNFRALMRWNRSTYFATAVGLFADRIGS